MKERGYISYFDYEFLFIEHFYKRFKDMEFETIQESKILEARERIGEANNITNDKRSNRLKMVQRDVIESNK